MKTVQIGSTRFSVQNTYVENDLTVHVWNQATRSGLSAVVETQTDAARFAERVLQANGLGNRADFEAALFGAIMVESGLWTSDHVKAD